MAVVDAVHVGAVAAELDSTSPGFSTQGTSSSQGAVEAALERPTPNANANEESGDTRSGARRSAEAPSETVTI